MPVPDFQTIMLPLLRFAADGIEHSMTDAREALAKEYALTPDERAEWVLCQVTSNPYGDPNVVALTGSSFASGGLSRDSFARPGKLFTASASIIVREAGALVPEAHCAIVKSVVKLVESGVH